MIEDMLTRNYPFLDSRICNSKSGLVSRLFQWIPEPDDPRVYMVASRTARMDIAGHIMPSEINSAAGLSLRDAYYAAVGETIERYCGSFIHDDLRVSTYDDLGELAVDPGDFAFYADNQYGQKGFPFAKFTKSTRVAWTHATNLYTGRTTLVPAATVYLPYYFRDSEEHTWLSISTGLAASTNIVDAILRGIYEVVERDAISNMWFNHLSMPRIDFMSDPLFREMYEKYFKIPNCTHHLIDISTDTGIPTVFGVLSEHGRGALVAAAANANPYEAMKKVMIELSQGRISWKTDFVEGVSRSFRQDFSDIRDFNSRVELYTKAEMKDHLRFVYSSPAVTGIPSSRHTVNEPEKILNSIVSYLHKKGLTVYFADLTPEDIRRASYCVVRVLIPGMTEISEDTVYPRLGGSRIRKLPVELGYRSQPRTFEQFYTVPHPFP